MNEEMKADIHAYDFVKNALNTGDEELIPSRVVDALLDGENPIRIWREYRGFSQVELAEQAGISKSYLSQLETDKRTGTADVLVKLARILNLSVDDLLNIID